MPEDLPEPVEVEAGEARTFDGPGTWVPPELDAEIGQRLLMLSVYPERCQAVINGAWRVADAQRSAAIDCALAAATARAAAVNAKREAGWPTWQVVLVAGGAGVAGVVLGVVAGLVAAR